MRGVALGFSMPGLERAAGGRQRSLRADHQRAPAHSGLGRQRDQRRAFHDANRDRLADDLTAAFKRKDYDGGLLEAVSYVQKTMAEHLDNTTHFRAASSARRRFLGNIQRNAPIGGGRGMGSDLGRHHCGRAVDLFCRVAGHRPRLWRRRWNAPWRNAGGRNAGRLRAGLRLWGRRRRRRLHERHARRPVWCGGRQLAL